MFPPSTEERARSSAGSLRLALIVIVAAAAALRFWGLRQGIPFALGVDEPEVMERAVRMMKTGDFNPHFYDYPALYIYLQAIVAVIRFIAGAMHAEWAALDQAPVSAFYLWARGLTALLGTVTVFVVYRCGMRWGAVTAILAAALVAVMPLHVRESHYVLTDVPMTLLVALTFLCTLRALERSSIRAFAIAGATAGLAAAVKYNGILAVLMPIAACLAGRAVHGRRAQAAAVTTAVCVATFITCAPYTLLDLPGFLNGFGRLATMYSLNPVGEPVAITYLKHLRQALGWTGGAFVLLGLGFAAWRAAAGPDRARWTILLLFPVVYFAFVSRQHIVYARYLLPIVPFLAVIAAAVIAAAVAGLRHARMSPAVRRAVAVALVIVAVAPSLRTAVLADAERNKVWTTELAYEWIRHNLPAGSSLLIESRGLVFSDGYNVRNTPQLRTAVATQQPEYLVASSQVYGEYFGNPTQFPQEYADYVRLFRQSQELARFVPSRDHPGPEIRILKVVR